MSKQVNTTEFFRRRFDRLNAYYGAKGIAPQLSMLRIEEDLVNGQGVYNFNIKKEPISGAESNLKRNDLFVCLAIGLATRVDDGAKPNVSVPDFSPRLATVTTSGSAVTIVTPGFETDDVRALYNGSMFIQTGNIVNFADLPTSLFLRQQSDDFTLSASDHAVRSKKFNLEDDLKTMAEELVFAGTQEHTIKVSFPTYAAANYAAQQAKDANGDVITNNKSKLIFLALGYRVVGGTAEQYRQDENNPYAGMI